eukprot:jgi/Bigna1/85967/estExt_fgenesh1_pg.C_70137
MKIILRTVLSGARLNFVAAAQRMQVHSSTPVQQSAIESVPEFKVGGRSSFSGVTATVFGCSGFLGPHVVNNLGKIGSRVVTPFRGDGMSIRPLKMMGDLGQIVAVPFDIRDPASVEAAVSKSNVVINCIGNEYATRNFSYRQTYVDSTKTIVEACKKAGVSRIVNISAVNASLDSESPWLQANAEADELLHSEFPDATTLKVTRMFGLQDKFITKYCSFANQAPFTPLINHGDQLVQPVYVVDVADAVANTIVKSDTKGKTYYIGGPEVLQMKNVIEELHDQLYLRISNAAPVPTKVARMMGYALENLRMVLPQVAIMTEDQVLQDQYDNVVPPMVLTLEDLDVTKPTALTGKMMDTIVDIHRGERGPETKPKGRRTWDEVAL